MRSETLRELSYALGALIVFWIVSWALLAIWAHERGQEQEQRWSEGWTWHLAQERSLVGGAPKDLDYERLDDGIRLDPEKTGYLALNFAGDRIDTERFHGLVAFSDRAFTAHMYFREQLDGPAYRAIATFLPGRVVDLADLIWRSDEKGVPWGGLSRRAATLRLHIVDPGPVAIQQFRLLPSGEKPLYSVTLPAFKVTPEAALVALDTAIAKRPTLAPEIAIAPAVAWAIVAATGLALLALYARYPLSAATVLAGFAYCIAPEQTLRLAALAAALGLAAWATWRGWSARTTIRTPMQAAGRDLLAPAVIMGIVLLGIGVSFEVSFSTSDVAGKLMHYLPWALVQQLILVYVLRTSSGSEAGLKAGIAFGLLHTPNFTLMCITSLLGVFICYFYERHGRIWPTVIMHAIGGSLFLLMAPPVILYSGDIGFRFFS